MLKGLLDFLFALSLLLLLSPFLILVILLIWIAERKSSFFLQDRVGKNKRLFRIYKFRTMLDGQITPIGKVLRRTGIDELPQMVNILIGQMSFVGPRPLTQADLERLGWNDEFHKKRWSVKPGIVGLAQLAPVCHKKMSWFYDQLYLKKQTIGLYFKIVMAAASIPLVGKQKVKHWIHGKR